MLDVHAALFEETIGTDKELIPVSPLCEFFGLDTENQLKKIKSDPILSAGQVKKAYQPHETGKKVMVLLNKKAFIRWLQLINPKTVREELRVTFTQCQVMIFDYLYGSADMLDSAKIQYQRLHELEKQEKELRREKAKIKRNLAGYVDHALGQGEIPFGMLEG